MLTRLMVIMTGSVKDGDCFAGDSNDKEILPVPAKMKTTRLT